MITAVHPSSADKAEARKYGLCWHDARAERWPCGEVRVPPPEPPGPSILCPMGHRHPLPVTDGECWLGSEEFREVAVTLREFDVASEILKTGANNRDVGRKLYVSEDTVKSHVKKLLERTGAASRTELVVAVFRGHIRLVPMAMAARSYRASKQEVA